MLTAWLRTTQRCTCTALSARRALHSTAQRRAPPRADTAPAPTQPPASICPENTELTGLNYLKGQPPVLALADSAYPEWLWTITEPRPIPDDGPGGKGERMLMRIANRKRIKEQNFMSKR